MNYKPKNYNKMKDWFEQRTKRHIELVKKYCIKIANQNPKFVDLINRAKIHDQSKFKEPECAAYIFISWQYKCKDDGVDFTIPSNISDLMHQATHHHVTNNSHHAEYHCKNEVDLINKEDRDKPVKEIIDATSMPNIDIAEMVADWCAMGEEKGNHPKEWADKNIGVRWKFNDEQKKLIYDLMNDVFEG